VKEGADEIRHVGAEDRLQEDRHPLQQGRIVAVEDIEPDHPEHPRAQAEEERENEGPREQTSTKTSFPKTRPSPRIILGKRRGAPVLVEAGRGQPDAESQRTGASSPRRERLGMVSRHTGARPSGGCHTGCASIFPKRRTEARRNSPPHRSLPHHVRATLRNHSTQNHGSQANGASLRLPPLHAQYREKTQTGTLCATRWRPSSRLLPR
jgi:hypothetical protein